MQRVDKTIPELPPAPAALRGTPKAADGRTSAALTLPFAPSDPNSVAASLALAGRTLAPAEPATTTPPDASAAPTSTIPGRRATPPPTVVSASLAAAPTVLAPAATGRARTPAALRALLGASTGEPLEDEPPPPGFDEALTPGTIVVDRYEILGVLGEGGMGTVYLARHIEIGRQIALKVLLEEWSTNSFIVRRFRAEARTASAIGHPNIIQVLDAGVFPDGRLFLVMEHLDGRDLGEVVRERGALAPVRAATIMLQVAEALAAAHIAGVVHRDLKPGNVMLVAAGASEVVKVLDFGIAANTAATAIQGERLTRPGALMGTPEYMASEQATGAAPAPTFDVYALGVILFELLTGSLPLVAEHGFELLTLKHRSSSPSLRSRAPELPDALIDLVDACLAIDPRERPRDGAAVAAGLVVALEALGDAERFAVAASAGRESIARPMRSPQGATTRVTHRAREAAAPATLDGRDGAAGAVLAADPSFAAAAIPADPPADLPAAHDSAAAERVPASNLRPRIFLGLAAVALVAVIAAMMSGGEGSTPAPAPDTVIAAAVDPTPPLHNPPSTDPPSTDPPSTDPPSTDPPSTDPPILVATATATADGPPTPAKKKRRDRTTAASKPREDTTPRCERVRRAAEDAGRFQQWSVLREQSRHRECWEDEAAARKLETKAMMELGDFSGCVSSGRGLTDAEVQRWLKLCRARAGISG